MLIGYKYYVINIRLSLAMVITQLTFIISILKDYAA